MKEIQGSNVYKNVLETLNRVHLLEMYLKLYIFPLYFGMSHSKYRKNNHLISLLLYMIQEFCVAIDFYKSNVIQFKADKK